MLIRGATRLITNATTFPRVSPSRRAILPFFYSPSGGPYLSLISAPKVPRDPVTLFHRGVPFLGVPRYLGGLLYLRSEIMRL